MCMKRVALMLPVLFICAICISAGTDESFGIKVYPGAKLDAQSTKFLKEGLQIKGVAYRTSDPASKVIAFYKSQPGLKFMGGDAKNAMFKKDGGIDVTIQCPWQNMETGQMMKDTLISIVKNE